MVVLPDPEPPQLHSRRAPSPPVDDARHGARTLGHTAAMVRPPAPLPPELGGAFTCADAVAGGLTRARLRHPGLLRPTRGLRLTTADPDLASRAAAYRKVLPARSAYSHATAAALLGLPCPRDTDLHVMLPGDVFVRRRGVVMHHGLERRPVWFADDLPVVSPVMTWLDLAAQLSVEDLVVLGDAILHRQPDLGEELRQTVRRNGGSRGIRRAREAIALIRPGVLSPQESLWRLRFRAAGFPEPALNLHVHDRSGAWLGMGDFVWKEERVIAEYDGEYHFTVEQRRKDQVRRRAMRAGDWEVIELNGADNANPRPALRSIAQSLGRRRP